MKGVVGLHWDACRTVVHDISCVMSETGVGCPSQGIKVSVSFDVWWSMVWSGSRDLWFMMPISAIPFITARLHGIKVE